MRDILPESQIHPAASAQLGSYRKEEVAALKGLIATHRVLIVGMAQNPFPKKARRLLDEKGIVYEYLGIGSYLSEWKRRLALKLWTGWPTFPMIFIDGLFIGGFDELAALVASGELQTQLAARRA